MTTAATTTAPSHDDAIIALAEGVETSARRGARAHARHRRLSFMEGGMHVDRDGSIDHAQLDALLGEHRRPGPTDVG